MRRILVFIISCLISLNALAQAPEKMSYQAVVRDNANGLVADKVVGMRISILRGSVTGTAAYVETQSPRSNTNGLITLEIGAGTLVSGSFAGLNWSTGPYFIQTEIDPSGGSNYSILGVSQLVSVPYALYAKTSGSSTPGPAGPIGTTGPAGPQGPIGPTGQAGAAGPQGPQGDQGPQGAKGDTGAIGPQGPIGLTGPAGSNGSNGAIGAQGDQGPQGAKGDKGDKGDTGVAGPQGLIGPIGLTGPAGPQGPAGAAASSANFVDLTSSQSVAGAKTFTSPIVGSLTGNAATATSLTGLTTSIAILNNLSGTNTGDQTTITGNAGTATKLAASKNINGVAFDGSADITVSAAAETLTGASLNTTVTGSSLTSVGTLSNLTVTNPIVGSITGNAATATLATSATKLANARMINGVGFDGTQDINIPSNGLNAGDVFGGGIVFYTWANGKHGLIAAMDDIASSWNWSSNTTVNTMAKADGIGAGNKNTMLILARQGLEAGPYAASVCNEFKVDIASAGRDIGNFSFPINVYISDWYLPSKYELEVLDSFALQYGANDPNQNWIWVEGRARWSSTEIDASKAWALDIQYQTFVQAPKTSIAFVRPIRIF